MGILLAAFLALTLETGRAHAAGGDFSFQGYLNRIVTPNGDLKNDLAILCVDNPKDFAVRGRIFDLRGHVVTEMFLQLDPTFALGATKPVVQCRASFPGQFKPQALTWDGRANGTAVTNGVYIWRIEAEETAVTGTVVVAR
ncbi:MAG: hypothetical protein HY928_08720 [Elusimicrobia bacterium]|nr:hypothetical protein [Elusimicrobiota bacterium]